MKINFSNWSINSKLALLAFILGLIAIFMRDPTKANIVTVNASDLAFKVQDKSSKISVEELANWLIQKRADFKLIDLQDVGKYKEFNIPSSINLSSTEILNLNYPKGDKIIIYSDDNLQAAQAWFLLKSKQYKAVYLLSGGLSEWKDKILFPTISENATIEERAKFSKLSEISKYFGGSPRVLSQGAIANEVQVSQSIPKMAPPTLSNGKASGGKPKREGC